MNTTEFMMITSAICPDRPCVIFEGKRYSFGEVADRVNRLANALQGMGVQKGDPIAVLQVNCNQFVEIYFASAKVGAIFVPLNFRAKDHELTHMLNNSESKVLFSGDRYIDMVNSMKADLISTPQLVSLDSKVEGMANYDELLANSSPDEVFTDIGDDDVPILMYTAGTTGLPKGVPLRHNAFVDYALQNVTPVDPDIQETNIVTVPLYHVAGIQAMMAAVYG
ncbi:MAG: AMP-binding protein, partial [Chloroflexi bacterium]|nr:AMP-binding protein [Chloroflexota bacterium]